LIGRRRLHQSRLDLVAARKVPSMRHFCPKSLYPIDQPPFKHDLYCVQD
jgi:hypothetical protein